MTPYNNTFYLSTEYRLMSEAHECDTILATVSEKGYEHFGNNHSSFYIKDNNNEDLRVGSWLLNEININRQWNESHFIGIVISQEGLPPIDISDLVKKSDRAKGVKWINSPMCYEEMIKHAIKFIQNLPDGYVTKPSLVLFFQISSCVEKSSLIDFYRNFINSKDRLFESEVNSLDELFLSRLRLLLLKK